jgi:hypothetical protein
MCISRHTWTRQLRVLLICLVVVWLCVWGKSFAEIGHDRRYIISLFFFCSWVLLSEVSCQGLTDRPA